MTTLETLNDGLIEQLKDVYSAENQLLKAIPKLISKATNPKLKQALQAHLAETEGQVARLEQIGTQLKAKLTGHLCKAMKGLIEEGEEMLKVDSENAALIDVLLVAAARRVEHYEMAAYCTMRAMAEELGETKIAKLFIDSFEEEEKADETLLSILEDEILADANAPMLQGTEDSSRKENSSQKPQKSKKSESNVRLFGFLSCLFLVHQVANVALAETNEHVARNENVAEQYKPDNTGKNVRDRNDTRKTADDQNLIGSETEVVARIRREIMANDSLSTNAHNVKIVVEDGRVLLRGPVKSDEERTVIGSTASRVASGFRVVNQLEVAPS